MFDSSDVKGFWYIDKKRFSQFWLTQLKTKLVFSIATVDACKVFSTSPNDTTVDGGKFFRTKLEDCVTCSV